MDHFSFALRHL